MNDTANQTDYFPPAVAIAYKMTGIMGVVAALENAFILVIFSLNRKLLNSSSLLVSLTIAHAINGAIHAVIGFWQVLYPAMMVHALFCIKVLWPILFISTFQLLPVLLAMNGLERLLAVGTPVWYRINCTSRRLWIASGLVFGAGLVSLPANAFIAWRHQSDLIPTNCLPPFLFGINYLIWAVHAPAIVGGVCAFVFTAVGVKIGRGRIKKLASSSKREMERVKKHMRLTKCLLLISSVDILLVVIPNMALLLYNTGIIHFPLRYTVYAVIMYCLDSVFNMVAFVLFNSEFRKVLVMLFSCNKQLVEPIISLAVTPSQTQRRLD